MTNEEYLLTCLMEECAEVTQMASKSIRFGLDNYHPDDPLKTENIEFLAREITDILAVVQMLEERGIIRNLGLSHAILPPAVQTKKEQVLKYARLIHGESFLEY